MNSKHLRILGTIENAYCEFPSFIETIQYCKELIEKDDVNITREELPKPPEPLKVRESLFKKENQVNRRVITVLPIHTVVFIILSTLMFGYETSRLQLVFQFNQGNLYYTIVGMLISLGLLIVSLISLKDWNKFINDNFINK